MLTASRWRLSLTEMIQHTDLTRQLSAQKSKNNNHDNKYRHKRGKFDIFEITSHPQQGFNTLSPDENKFLLNGRDFECFLGAFFNVMIYI